MSVYVVKELPALGYLYNVYNDVTCATHTICWDACGLYESFSTLMSWSNKNESCMRVDEICLARVCIRFFSTVMSWSNENKSCMRVDES